MPRDTYVVAGRVYANKEALKRAWKTKSKFLSAPVHATRKAEQDGVEYVDEETKRWYVEAALASAGRSDKLYGSHTDVETAMRATRVFVARADYSPVGGAQQARRGMQKYRTVFFQSAQCPDKCRSVSADPGKPAAQQARGAILKKLRDSIDDQIQLFRAAIRVVCNGLPGQARRPPICAHCMKPIKGESHVDHGVGDLSFRKIADDFLRTIAPPVCSTVYCDLVLKQLTPPQIEKWQHHHQKRAKLKLTCRPCNLKFK